MVQKTKGCQKKNSVKKGKVLKGQCKYNRKDNYKQKKNKKMTECNICFEQVEKTTDNSVMCGNVVHSVCGNCKLNITDKKCPMCRSHTIQTPKDVTHPLKIISKSGRFGKKITYQDRIEVIYSDDGHIEYSDEFCTRPRHLTK